MEDNERLLHLAEAVSDTSAAEIDWEQAAADAANDEERELVGLLRDIRAVADLRRTRAKDPGAPVARDAPPSSWGQFDVIDKLGEGAAAEVFRARDVTLDREVALKLFRHVGDVDTARRETLLREGRNLALVRHPNVVRVHGADEQDGRVGIWMELVSGRTLAEIVEAQGSCSASETAQIGIELCGAVASVHREALVHGDIKAQNVKREAGGRIVLMDFSSSREAAPSSEDSDTTGTPLYMAPELWESATPSVASDIYALGVLLYFLVTAEFPVRARTVSALRRAHARGERHRLRDERPGLPDAFVRTIEKALSRDPGARFHSMGELEEALREYTGTSPVTDAAARSPAEVPLPPEVRWLAVASRIAMGVGVTLMLFAALGFITSTALNVALGRSSDFAPETLGEWSVWGLRSLIGPMYHLITRMFSIAVIYAAARLAWKIRWVRRKLEPLANAAKSVSADPKRLANVVAGSGALVLAFLVLQYSDLISAMYALKATPISPATIAMLSPDNMDYHLDYRAHFTFLVTALVIGAVAIHRYARWRSQPSSWAGIGAVLVIALVLLEFPWQILWQANFPKVIAGDETCYEVGSKENDLQLFCPLSHHKTRIVRADETDFERTGIVESVFSLPNSSP